MDLKRDVFFSLLKTFQSLIFLEEKSIAWKKICLIISMYVLPDVNERILVIKMKSPQNICIVCVYMSVQNASASYIDYSECLDTIGTILSKIINTHLSYPGWPL